MKSVSTTVFKEAIVLMLLLSEEVVVVSWASPPPFKMASMMEEADWGDEPYVRSENEEAVAVRTVDASKVVWIRFIIVVLCLCFLSSGKSSMAETRCIRLFIR